MFEKEELAEAGGASSCGSRPVVFSGGGRRADALAVVRDRPPDEGREVEDHA